MGVTVVVALIGLAANVIRIAGSDLGDLEVYRVLAPRVFDEGALHNMQLGRLGFTYPAFAALPLSVFALMGRELATIVLTLLSLAALARVCFLLARAVLRDVTTRTGAGRGAPGSILQSVLVPVLHSPRALALVLFAGSLYLNPVMQTLGNGQINLLLLWLIVEDLIGDVPRRYRGLLVGLATGIKLTPGLFIVGFLVAGYRSAAVRAAACFVMTVVVGMLAERSSALSYWTNLGDSSAFGNTIGRWNQSLVYGLSRVTGDPHLAFIPLAVLVLVVAIVTAARLFATQRELAAWGTLATAGLVASPISWNHHWVAMLLPMAALLAMAPESRGARRLLGGTSVVMLLGLMWVAPQLSLTRDTWEPWAWLPGNAFVVVGLVVIGWFARLSLVTGASTERTSTERVSTARASGTATE